MDDLTAFLNARLDEDEAAAEACAGDSGLEWYADRAAMGFEPRAAAHIARHDPARVLREVAAIRAHIRMWEAFAVNFTHVDETEFEFAKREALEEVLAADAAIWSDHPDYPGRRQEAVTGG